MRLIYNFLTFIAMTTKLTTIMSANQAWEAFMASHRFWTVKWIGPSDRQDVPRDEMDTPRKYDVTLRSPERDQEDVKKMFLDFIKALNK